MAFDPSQVPGLLYAWNPSTNVTFDTSGNMTVAGTYGTAAAATGLVASQPSILSGFSPNGQNVFATPGGKFLSVPSTTIPAGGAFSVVWVLSFAGLAVTEILSHSTNPQDYVATHANANGIDFKRSTGNLVPSTFANTSQKVGLFPAVIGASIDFTANTITPYFNGVPGIASAADPVNCIGPWTFDRVGSANGTLAGQVGPIVVYNQVVSPANMLLLAQYFSNWTPSIIYVSSSIAGASDASISPWQKTAPFATITHAALVAPSRFTIAPLAGDLYRETRVVPINPNVTLDGSLWGTSRQNGLQFQGQGSALKAEIRWSTTPALTPVTGTRYSAGTLTPNTGNSQFGHFPNNTLIVIPGGRLQFGQQFAGANVNPGTPRKNKCLCRPFPQYSQNGIRLFRTKTQAISAISAGAGGVCRLTLPSTAGWVTGNKIFVANWTGTSTVNSASETSAGMQTYTVVNATQIDVAGTTFATGDSGAGWCYDATQQWTPAVGEWGQDTAGVNTNGDPVNTMYADAGIVLNTGDLEMPVNNVSAGNFDMNQDGWLIKNIISMISWQRTGGANSLNTNRVSFSNCEFYFASQDGFDTDNISQAQLDRCVFGWAGSGAAYQSGPGDLCAAHGVSVMNVTNSLCLYGDGTCGFDLADLSSSSFSNNVCIGHNFIRVQAAHDVTPTQPPGVETVFNNLLILDDDADGTVDSFAPYAVNDQTISSTTGVQHVMNLWNNTLISYHVKAPTTVGINKVNAGPIINARNNIIYGFATGIATPPGDSSYSGDYNLLANYVTPYSGTTGGIHNVLKDPKFKAAILVPTDYIPPVGSPAIGAGLSMSQVTVDAQNILRLSPPTIGAFEGSQIVAGGSSGPAYGRTYEPRHDDEEEAVLALLH